VMPRDEYNCLSLEGSENFHLEKIGAHSYRTVERITPGGACSVNLLYDASESYLIENYKKHWEVHLRGTTQEHKATGDFMKGGVDLRILVDFKLPLFLDVISDVEKGNNFSVKVVYGDMARTWEKIPENVEVDFNGVIKQLSDTGIVSFTFPDTRGEYDYKIEAKSDHYYLPVIKTIKLQSFKDSSFIPAVILDNMVLVIIIIIVVIAAAVIVIWWRRREEWLES